MRAISLWQPWASLIASGHKLIETRSWPTGYRGLIAIHASKQWTRRAVDLCVMHRAYRTALEDAGYIIPTAASLKPPLNQPEGQFLPLGCVVAIAELVDCLRVEQIGPTWQERHFGNFEDGRFAWLLANVQKLATPIPARGSKGFWFWKTPDEWTIGADDDYGQSTADA